MDGSRGRKASIQLLPSAARATPLTGSCCKLREKARVFNPFDALGQLEPSDALAAVSRGSFHKDLRRFASLWEVCGRGVHQVDYTCVHTYMY